MSGTSADPVAKAKRNAARAAKLVILASAAPDAPSVAVAKSANMTSLANGSERPETATACGSGARG